MKFEKSTLLQCTLEDIFDFHLDSNNIKKITPPHTQVTLLHYDKKMFEGKKIELKTTRLFISLKWQVIIKKISRPHMIVDEAIKSPFKYWRHEHIFTQKENKVLLQDIVEFIPPFGIFGKMIQNFLYKDISLMFDYRHQKTKEILEK